MRIIATRISIALAALCMTAPGSLAQDTISGRAYVIDGDTIEIAGIPIRLDGIDAPEQRQNCIGENNEQIACGKLATSALTSMIGGARVTCAISGKDSYDRLLADCAVNSESLNERMVREGWALAFIKYSQRFTGEEALARTQKVGLWRWQFDRPWDWRAGILKQAARTARTSPDECIIKGNISGGGERIYHMPFHHHYGKVRITESQGEKWFCTEGEAQAAGWRRALR